MSDTGMGSGNDSARDPKESDDRANRMDDDQPANPEEKPADPDDQPDALDERTARARTESMTVRSLGSELYEVEGESGERYLVAPLQGNCTCPDHTIRGERCKHLRRVGIEIARGTVPPLRRVTRHCWHCGEPLYVAPDTNRPQYCAQHRLSAGDVAIDRETGDLLFVVAVSDRRADDVTIDAADCTVAEYDRNEPYDPADRVVAAVYDSVTIDDHGPFPPELRVYSFPHGRLERVPDESTTKEGSA